jgi:hypothetical protein
LVAEIDTAAVAGVHAALSDEGSAGREGRACVVLVCFFKKYMHFISSRVDAATAGDKQLGSCITVKVKYAAFCVQ